VIGIASSLNSSIAISMGAMTFFGILMRVGAPIEICNARAPMMRAFSNRVYFKRISSLSNYMAEAPNTRNI